MTRLIRIMRGWPCADLAYTLAYVAIGVGAVFLAKWGAPWIMRE